MHQHQTTNKLNAAPDGKKKSQGYAQSDMEVKNYDIKADLFFNGVGFLRMAGEYAGEYQAEAYEILGIEGELREDEWCDICTTEDGTRYAVCGDVEATAKGAFYFKKCKEVICDYQEAVRECIIAAENDSGWTGFRIPLYASYDEADGEINFSIGEALSNGWHQPGAFECFSCEYWTRYWGEDDADIWAKECGHNPEDFDCEECFLGEVYELEERFCENTEEYMREAIVKYYPTLNIKFV